MRNNVLNWVDCKVVTKFSHELISEMMEYQGRSGNILGGDQSVMVAAINLRNRLTQIIDKSREANDPNVRRL
jgi:hypothetical protein